MTSLAGVVILYNADLNEVSTNIKGYLDYLDILFVIDNSEFSNVLFETRLNRISSKIKYYAFGENKGVAYALNFAANESLNLGYAYLLTMDQDSKFSFENAKKYFTQYLEYFNNNKSLGLIGPSLKVLPSKDIQVKGFTSVDSLITSGTILDLAVYRKVGGFNDSLFVDEVDHEYCYRVRSNRYYIFMLGDVSLDHQMGKSVVRGYFGFLFKSKRMVHAPIRIYYMIRNYLYVRKLYRDRFRAEFLIRDRSMLVILKNNLLFGGNLFTYLKFLLKGIIDYRKGIFGKILIKE